MQRVDSHCHIADGWYEPVETLLFQMDRCGVSQAVLVQMLGQFDNSYQQACRARHPDRFASVVAVDPAHPNAIDMLRRSVDDGAAGVRLRPNARSPCQDPFAIWMTAQKLGLAVSCVGPAAFFQSSEFATVLDRVAVAPIVLEHLGGLARPDVGDLAAMMPGLLALAARQNVYLKVPGLGQLAQRKPAMPTQGLPLEPGAADILHAVVKRFGSARLMWGSDFPVVSSREGYANALNWTREALGDLSPSDQSLIFGGVAREVFHLDAAR